MIDIQDDFGGLGAGLGGGLIAWLRTPNGWKGLGLGLLSGACAGFGLNAWLEWTYPTMPGNLRYFLAALSGILSGLGLELLFTLAAGFRSRVVALAARKADGWGLISPPAVVVSVSVPTEPSTHVGVVPTRPGSEPAGGVGAADPPAV